jgi:hypothetical protein
MSEIKEYIFNFTVGAVSFLAGSLFLSACTTKLVSNAPPLPQKVTQCEWDTAKSYFKGDAACEKFLRDYVNSRVGHT